MINKIIDAKETRNRATVIGPKLISASFAPINDPPQMAPRQINAIQFVSVGLVIIYEL